ncbi:hypothetical protein PROPEN_02620 [Proteus penneri ATCC 35198]|nr:hypothetical protein PROPEN_02620 [Proteus penneri ATCC 35198]
MCLKDKITCDVKKSIHIFNVFDKIVNPSLQIELKMKINVK